MKKLNLDMIDLYYEILSKYRHRVFLVIWCHLSDVKQNKQSAGIESSTGGKIMVWNMNMSEQQKNIEFLKDAFD